MKKSLILVIALIAVLLTACGGTATPAQLPPTTVPTEIATLVPTTTPTEVPTSTPTEVPTAEVKNYGICIPTDLTAIRACPIAEEDLFNGQYLAFLRSLSQPFDPAKFKNPMPEMVILSGSDWIAYDLRTAPNFPDPTTAPFHKNITSGVVTMADREVFVFPIEYADLTDPTNREKNSWVILVFGDRGTFPDGVKQQVLDWWNKMESPVIVARKENVMDSRTSPLMEKTWEAYPDMTARFERFIASDVSALDGIVLEAAIYGK